MGTMKVIQAIKAGVVLSAARTTPASRLRRVMRKRVRIAQSLAVARRLSAATQE
jgi:hypothetical protein